MDKGKRNWRKRLLNFTLAGVIGGMMAFAETWLMGLFALYYMPSDTYRATLLTWNAHLVPIGLSLAVCSVPCVLARFPSALCGPSVGYSMGGRPWSSRWWEPWMVVGRWMPSFRFHSGATESPTTRRTCCCSHSSCGCSISTAEPQYARRQKHDTRFCRAQQTLQAFALSHLVQITE